MYIYENEEVSTMWDNLIAYGIATEETLITITNIDGYNIDTLNDVLFSNTGYRDWEQFEEAGL